MKKLLFTLMMILSGIAMAEVKNINYKDGKNELVGKLVTKGSFDPNKPTIIVLHNWLGITDETILKANDMANEGMNAFVADIYGRDEHPNSLEEAKSVSTKYKTNLELLNRRISLAMNEVKKLKAKNIFVAGYCFGGTAAIEFARTGEKFNGAISFHGGLAPSLNDSKIKTSLLILHGAIDPAIKKDELDGFLDGLNKNNVDYDFISYSGAVHSFTDTSKVGKNATATSAYNSKADKRSWQSFKLYVDELTK